MMAIATEQRGYLSSKASWRKILDVESPIEAVRTILLTKTHKDYFSGQLP